MAQYPPYVNAYGKIKELFAGIIRAAVPTKFTQDFLTTVLGLNSSSDRALIFLLKRLEFLDAANVPTQAYKDYRDETKSKQIMAEQIRKGFSDLYKANEYAHRLDKSTLTSTLKRITGAAEGDAIIGAIVGTFMALKDLAEFDSKSESKAVSPQQIEKKETHPQKYSPEQKPHSPEQPQKYPRLGLSYTINLNLPATTEIEVFNAIFKSLKDNLLNER